MARTMLIRAPLRVYKDACKIASQKGVTIASALGYLLEGKDTLLREKDEEITVLREQLKKKPKTVTKTKIRKEKVKQFTLGICHRCGTRFHWDLDDPEEHGLLEKAVTKAEYVHTKCKDRTS